MSPRRPLDDDDHHDDHHRDDHHHDDHNITLDAAHDDWQWRAKIRANPHTHLIYRIIVGVVGLIIFVIGLILGPLPGPGSVVVLLGLAIWASEFAWAQRLLQRVKDALRGGTGWVRRQPWWVKALAAFGAAAGVAAIVWLLLLISGVPGYFPDGVEQWLKTVPGLAH